MKVYIGFSKPNHFAPFAWLIKKVESREYDHVYIRFQEPVNNIWMIFQASSTMVNMCPVTHFLTKNISLKEYEIDVDDSRKSELWEFMCKNLGIPYSIIEDIGILLMKIFKLKKQPFNKGMSAQFCSKLGATVCVFLGYSIPEDVSEVDPTLLDSILEGENLPCVNNPVLIP